MCALPSCAAGVPIFRVLPEPALAELSESMHHRRFARGELVTSAGEPVQHLIVVARGRLKLAHSNRSGREQVVRTLGPGEFLGELALFAPASMDGDLTALEETEACLVPREAVQTVLRRHPEAALQLVASLAQRLAEAEQVIGSLGLRDVEQRLAAELLRLAEDGRTARMPVAWSELAVQLGTTPESLSRRLKSLAEQGIIQREGTRTVIIRDAARLRLLADG